MSTSAATASPVALAPPPDDAGQDGAAWLPRLYLILLVLLGAAYAWRPLRPGDDFWSHAAVGRWIWQHGQVPHQTLLLWTPAQPWIAHSWLSELTFFGLLAAGGPRGGPYLALAFTALMAALPF